MSVSKSATLFERAKKVLPGGVSRNTILKAPHPDYVAFGKGCYVTDVDGVTRIDFANNMASLIHGHANEVISAAICEQVAKGTAFTLASEVEIEFAELLCKRVAGFEKLRFVNSGTEAVMAMLKAARAYTGKTKIAKVEGAYHGAYDYAEVSQTAAPKNWGIEQKPNSVPVAQGTPQSALDDVIIIPYNDIDTALKILEQYKDELAGILLDPISHRVGMVPAEKKFVHALYDWTRSQQALLLFDEVITFRTYYGGAQQLYDIAPDLTALGKMIGGGFPVGAIAGSAAVMAVFDPFERDLKLPHSGTFSANPVTMTAGLTAMTLFDQEAVNKLNKLTDYAKKSIEQAANKVAIQACVTGAGSMFRIHLKANAPTNYRETYPTYDQSRGLKIILDHLYESGILMINTCSAMLSTAMTKKEIDILTQHVTAAFEKAVNEIPSLKRDS